MIQRQFRKYAGAGNDFVILDAVSKPIEIQGEALEAFVQKACARESGLGSDGLILLEKSDRAAFAMRFFNPDGSYGALCGNGSRCAVQAAFDERIISGNTTEFEVLGAINHAKILSDQQVRVFFQDPKFSKLNFKIRIGKKDFVTSSYVDLGSQHTVTFFEDLFPFSGGTIGTFDMTRFGSVLRWHPDLQPVGANANFAQIQQDDQGPYIRIRTFERGVEGETLACGTGCMSTAIIAYLSSRIKDVPIRLKTQSGEFVQVNFTYSGNLVTNLSLEGSAIRGIQGVIEFDEVSGKLGLG